MKKVILALAVVTMIATTAQASSNWEKAGTLALGVGGAAVIIMTAPATVGTAVIIGAGSVLTLAATVAAKERAIWCKNPDNRGPQKYKVCKDIK